MQSLNEQVYVLNELQDDLRGKQSSVQRVSNRAIYPLVREFAELGFKIFAIGRAPFAVPDQPRLEYSYFVGPAIVGVPAEDANSTTAFGGHASLTVAGDRVLGIVVPDQKILGVLGRAQLALNEAVLTFASPRSEITVSSSGSAGVFKKRPSQVSLEGKHWDCHLPMETNRIHIRQYGEPRLQGGQENELIAVLGAR